MADHSRHAMRSAVSLGVIALMAVTLVSGVFALTRGRIAGQEHRQQRQALAAILPATRHDNDPIADSVSVLAPAWLGSGQPVLVHRARLNGNTSALVVEAFANDGHNGSIRLLVGVEDDGRIGGMQITSHRETPGFDDQPDAAQTAWLDGFRGRTLADLADADWKVSHDGDLQKNSAGALREQCAVLEAVRLTLKLIAKHGEEIHRAQTGATLEFNDAPVPAMDE